MKGLVGLKISKAYINNACNIILFETNLGIKGYYTENCMFESVIDLSNIRDKTIISVINQEIMFKDISYFYNDIITIGCNNCRITLIQNNSKRCFFTELDNPIITNEFTQLN